LKKRPERDKISLDKLSGRSATKFFVKSKFVTPTAEQRMKESNLKEHKIELIYSLPFNVTKHSRGRCGGLMVSGLVSRSSGPGLSPGQGHCVVFLGKTLNSHSASLHPGV